MRCGEQRPVSHCRAAARLRPGSTISKRDSPRSTRLTQASWKFSGGPSAGGGSRCRPRVRSVADDDGGVEWEVHLESYDTFASVDLLAEHMVASMLPGLPGLPGLSGRRYASALEPVGETVTAIATSTSQSFDEDRADTDSVQTGCMHRWPARNVVVASSQPGLRNVRR